MRIEAVGQTDVGRKRGHNEDFYMVDDNIGLYIVCDGMGGHAAGEVASEHATKTVHRIMLENIETIQVFKEADTPKNREQITSLIEKAVQKACSEIYNMAKEDQSKSGMGTTLVMMLIVNGKGCMGHVGDSRLYMSRKGKVHQLSEDHSYVSEMIRRGKMTVEEAKNSQFGNVITRAVGIQESVQVDTLVLDILPEDTFLICSDGLSGYIDDPEELQSLLSADEIKMIPQTLIDISNNRGGKDNITAIVIRSQIEEDSKQDVERAKEVNLKLDTLKKIPLFRYLTYQELVKVVNITYLEIHETGDKIITEGEYGDKLFVLLSGVAEVIRQEQHIINLEAGVHFGEMALVDQAPRSATIIAKEKCRLLVVPRKGFYTLIRKEAVLAVKLLWSFVQVLSGRLRETNNQLSGIRTELDTLKEVPFMDSSLLESVEESAEDDEN